MLNEYRYKKISELVLKQGKVSVAELEKTFSVSDMTIRRDLAEMNRKGLLKRVHGGAVALDYVNKPDYDPENIPEYDRKQQIAESAAALIKEGMTIYLGAGTTCQELARQIIKVKNITVVTNGLLIADILRGSRFINTVVLGGEILSDGHTLGGTMAKECAEKFSVDLCLFSAAGFNTEVITNATIVGVDVKKTMIKNANKRIFLADSTKYGQKGFYELSDIKQINLLITDKGLTRQRIKKLEKSGISVQIAK